MARPARPWFRFYVEAITSDRKIRRLDIKHRWLWVAVLGMARQSPTPGQLLIAVGVPFELGDVADFAGMSERDARAGMAALEATGVIERDDAGVWSVPKWNERQFEGDYSRSAIPDDVRAEVLSRDNGQCVECGSTDDLQIDHVVPVTRGGTNELENLQVLCGKCNRRKSNRVRQQRHRSRSTDGDTRDNASQPSRHVSVQRTDTDTDTDTEKEPPVVPRPPASASLDAEFEQFWSLYPARDGKKLARGEALKQWRRLSAAKRDAAMTGVDNYAASGQRAKDAFRWLRDEHFNDWQTPASLEPVVTVTKVDPQARPALQPWEPDEVPDALPMAAGVSHIAAMRDRRGR